MGSIFLLNLSLVAQEIILLPQGKDQPFPDIKLVETALYSIPFTDCMPCEDTPLMQTINKEDLEGISKLLQNGADINELPQKTVDYNCPCESPLSVGVSTGNKKIVSYLLEQGAKPKNSTVWGKVIEKNQKEIAELLLAHGIYPQMKDLRNMIVQDESDLLKTVLRKDKNISNQQKEEILKMAKDWLNDDVVSFLDPNYQRLKKALENKDTKKVKNIVISAGPNLARYMLLQFSAVGDLDAIKTLFSSEINLQTEYTDVWGNTPLMLAVMNEHLDIAQFLLEKGAQADVTVSFFDFTSPTIAEGYLDATAYTALMKALERKDQTMVDLLIKYGAKDRLLILPGITMEGPHLRTISAGINKKCARHRKANYWLYGGPGYPYPVTEESWEKECDFPTESQVYHYFFDNFKP